MSVASTYVGKQIGNYRIVTQLSSSFFRRVFRGQHIYLAQHVVAIKLLHTYLDSLKERERFLQEARLLAALKHRHILPIIDVGLYENLPYLVVEYAHNGSLRERMKRLGPSQPFPLEEALIILRQVGQALQYAHEQNIVHRDLKPENILLNFNNEALLADFNIATVLETAQTKSMDIIGSPLYMAPEQFEGTVSKRSDQYALACIAYELFTGQPPFVAPNAFGLSIKHKNEQPRPLTALNVKIPRHIEQAVLKAMAKERNDRHRDVATFINELYLAPLPVTTGKTATQSPSQFRLNRCEEKLATYAHAILNPESALFHTQRGDLLYELHRDEEALAAYEQAVQIDAHMTAAHEGKGNALYYLNRYEEALVAYDQAIQLSPRAASSYDGKAWVLWHLKRYEEALLMYEKAIALDPSNASAHNGRGNVLMRLRRYQEAAAAYEEASRLDPRDPRLAYAHYGKGRALFELQRYQEALQAFDAAIRLDPGLAYPYSGRGDTLWGLQQYEEALASYDRAIALDPTHEHFYRNKGKLLKMLGRVQEAEQAYNKARELGYNG